MELSSSKGWVSFLAQRIEGAKARTRETAGVGTVQARIPAPS